MPKADGSNPLANLSPRMRDKLEQLAAAKAPMMFVGRGRKTAEALERRGLAKRDRSFGALRWKITMRARCLLREERKRNAEIAE